MGSKRLENAAAAAGFAMVNPDDFARESQPVPRGEMRPAQKEAAQTEAKSWLNWDYWRVTGAKATTA